MCISLSLSLYRYIHIYIYIYIHMYIYIIFCASSVATSAGQRQADRLRPVSVKKTLLRKRILLR